MTKRKPAPVPPPPGDLSPESSALWAGLAHDVAAVMGGAEVDFVQLADVLRAADRLSQLRAVLDTEGPTVAGSKGQTRPHPLLVTESVLRREVAAGFAKLRLAGPDRWRFEVTRHGRLTRDSFDDF